MERVVRIFHSFEEAEAAEEEYWRHLPGHKKLEVLEVIRANYWALRNEAPGRLQRVYRIIKRSSG